MEGRTTGQLGPHRYPCPRLYHLIFSHYQPPTPTAPTHAGSRMYVRALSPTTTTLRRKKEEPQDPYASAQKGPNYHALVSPSAACVGPCPGRTLFVHRLIPLPPHAHPTNQNRARSRSCTRPRCRSSASGSGAGCPSRRSTSSSVLRC